MTGGIPLLGFTEAHGAGPDLNAGFNLQVIFSAIGTAHAIPAFLSGTESF
jgi:hypothetical protein